MSDFGQKALKGGGYGLNRNRRLMIAFDSEIAAWMEEVRQETYKAMPKMRAMVDKRLKMLKEALLHEVLNKEAMNNPAQLAAAIKHLPITLASTRPIDEAISSAGGVRLEALDAHLMASTLPGLFVAGEMLDWEAPTGGYLLSACLASGRVAGLGAMQYLR